MVTHCGHGTTIKALAAGVPLVCLPMGRDQNDVAARVVHRGAGVRLDPGAPAEQIAAAVRGVIDDPSYAAAAGRIAASIAEETAEDRAVAEIEAVLVQGLAEGLVEGLVEGPVDGLAENGVGSPDLAGV